MSQPFLQIHTPSSSSSYNYSCNILLPSASSFPTSSSSSSLITSHSPSSSVSFRAHGTTLPSLSAIHHQQQQQQQRHVQISDSSDSPSPLSVDLTPISNDDQFDQLVAQTHQHPLIIVWMANWCRKCIYLKPKLEKLAAEYYPRLRFYSVDVNKVSHKLVARAGVTKMPTIQLWKDGKSQAEVIGGHNAYWIIGDVQEMIENECAM